MSGIKPERFECRGCGYPLVDCDGTAPVRCPECGQEELPLGAPRTDRGREFLRAQCRPVIVTSVASLVLALVGIGAHGLGDWCAWLANAAGMMSGLAAGLAGMLALVLFPVQFVLALGDPEWRRRRDELWWVALMAFVVNMATIAGLCVAGFVVLSLVR